MEGSSKTSAGAASGSGLLEGPLVEILSRLPAKSVCRFKCVSNGWCDLIADPAIRKKLRQAMQGLFVQSVEVEDHDEEVTRVSLSFSMIDMTARYMPFSFSFLTEMTGIRTCFFLDSCNGLVLLGHRQENHASVSDYFVCNPTTKEWLGVPACGSREMLSHTYLAFDPAISSHFHLVQFQMPDADTKVVSLHVYSSETGTWSQNQLEGQIDEQNEQGQLEGQIDEQNEQGQLEGQIDEQNEQGQLEGQIDEQNEQGQLEGQIDEQNEQGQLEGQIDEQNEQGQLEVQIDEQNEQGQLEGQIDEQNEQGQLEGQIVEQNEQGQLEGWHHQFKLEVFDYNCAFVNGLLHLIVSGPDRQHILVVDIQGKARKIITVPSMADWSQSENVTHYLGQSQGQLHCMTIKSVDEINDKLFIWVLQDSDTEVWALKTTVNSFDVFGETVVRPEYSVVDIHQDSNVLFFLNQLTDELIAYNMDRKEVSALATFEGYYFRGDFARYIPYFLESPALTNKH